MWCKMEHPAVLGSQLEICLFERSGGCMWLLQAKGWCEGCLLLVKLWHLLVWGMHVAYWTVWTICGHLRHKAGVKAVCGQLSCAMGWCEGCLWQIELCQGLVWRLSVATSGKGLVWPLSVENWAVPRAGVEAVCGQLSFSGPLTVPARGAVKPCGILMSHLGTLPSTVL